MNDNEPLGDYGIPVWACEIVDKHELGQRAYNTLDAARVLLADARYMAQKIVAKAFREQALTPSTNRQLRKIIDMLIDVESLTTICEDEPSFGVVTVQPDGTQTWEPAPQ